MWLFVRLDVGVRGLGYKVFGLGFQVTVMPSSLGYGALSDDARLPFVCLSIKFNISVAHCRLDFTKKNSRKSTSAMLNVNTTKITIVD